VLIKILACKIMKETIKVWLLMLSSMIDLVGGGIVVVLMNLSKIRGKLCVTSLDGNFLLRNEKESSPQHQRCEVRAHIEKSATPSSLCYGALVGSTPFLGGGRAVDQESSQLHLANSVEGDKANVGIGEGVGAGLDFLDNLGTIRAAKHGELPHGPVAAEWVRHEIIINIRHFGSRLDISNVARERDQKLKTYRLSW
jgi:hypothetical protein